METWGLTLWAHSRNLGTVAVGRARQERLHLHCTLFTIVSKPVVTVCDFPGGASQLQNSNGCLANVLLLRRRPDHRMLFSYVSQMSSSVAFCAQDACCGASTAPCRMVKASNSSKAGANVDILTTGTSRILKKLGKTNAKSAKFNLDQIGGLQIASMCSGTEVQACVGKVVVEALGKKASKYTTEFACEKDEKKANVWIKGIMNPAHGCPDACISTDVCDLGRRHARCWRHDQECPVPHGTCNLAIASWSCKDLSNLKTTGSSGTTESTLKGVLAFLAASRPLFYLGENLEAIMKAELRNNLEHDFAGINYVVDMVDMSADDYGAVTTRKRAYVIGIECQESGIDWEVGKKIARDIVALAGSLKIEAEGGFRIFSPR